MARYDHLPIWKTAMDLAVLLELAEGIPHIGIAETGYLKCSHKRRELVCSWAPPGVFPSFIQS